MDTASHRSLVPRSTRHRPRAISSSHPSWPMVFYSEFSTNLSGIGNCPVRCPSLRTLQVGKIWQKQTNSVLHLLAYTNDDASRQDFMALVIPKTLGEPKLKSFLTAKRSSSGEIFQYCKHKACNCVKRSLADHFPRSAHVYQLRTHHCF